jgi:hypothetical protein
MPEWKQLLAVLSVCMLIAWVTMPMVLYGPLLDDPEFDRAMVWWSEQIMPYHREILEYPFSVMTRARAAELLVWYAGEVWLSYQRDEEACVFSDLQVDNPSYSYTTLINACQYWFFQWSQWKFFPEQYVSKAEAIVALVRTLYPDEDFASTEPYRDSYVTFAYNEGITFRPTWPYLMYLVPMYEFVLLMWRLYINQSTVNPLG